MRVSERAFRGCASTIVAMRTPEETSSTPVENITAEGKSTLSASRTAALVISFVLVLTISAGMFLLSSYSSVNVEAKNVGGVASTSGTVSTSSTFEDSSATSTSVADGNGSGVEGTLGSTSLAGSAPAGTSPSVSTTAKGNSTESTTTQKPTTRKKPAATKLDTSAPTKVTSETTPAPSTSTTGKFGFSGADFPNGATVGEDISSGRFWAKNCWSWTVSNDNGTVAASSLAFEQSIIDLRNGDFFLSSTKCTWFAGNPTASQKLPTGKVAVGEQLTPGRWRAAVTDGCVTGPTSFRSRAAVTDGQKMVIWYPETPDLVVTGKESWDAYLVGLECGGLIKVG
jgi:hypothetical protein